MNLLLLAPEDIHSNNGVNPTAEVSGRQAQHLLQTNKVIVGDTIKAGIVNGQMGTATVTHIEDQRISLALNLHSQPPAPLPLTLIMALPRPKMLKRTLQTIATMGVKRLYFINSYRVEKAIGRALGSAKKRYTSN